MIANLVMSYQPPFTITSKMLTLVSEIVEIITDIKHNENVPKNVPRNDPKNRLDEIVKLIEKNKEITSIQIAERLKGIWQHSKSRGDYRGSVV